MNFQFPTGFSQVLTGLTIGAEFWDFQFPTGFSLAKYSSDENVLEIAFQFPTGFSRSPEADPKTQPIISSFNSLPDSH